MTNFLLHSGASDRSHFGAWAPFLAANRTASLLANRAAATGLVAATAAARIPFPGTGVADAFLNDWTWNLLRFRHPFAGAERNLLGFTNRLANGVTNVAIAGLGFGTISGAANVAILRFADWLADRAADIAVASLEAGLTNRAADIAIAGLEAWFTNRAADIAIAGLDAWLTNRAADVAIAGLVNRLANGVAFIAVAGFVDVTRTGHGDLFRALFVNGAAAVNGSLFINRFTNGFVTGTTATLRGTVVAARRTRRRRTALVTGSPAIRGFDSCVHCECQHTREDDPGCVSHRSVL